MPIKALIVVRKVLKDRHPALIQQVNEAIQPDLRSDNDGRVSIRAQALGPLISSKRCILPEVNAMAQPVPLVDARNKVIAQDLLGHPTGRPVISSHHNRLKYELHSYFFQEAGPEPAEQSSGQDGPAGEARDPT